MAGEQIGQNLQNVVMPQPSGHGDRQALTRELIDHRQHPERPAVMGAVLHEVIGPDMVAPARAQTNARPIVEPQSPAFGLFRGHFQPLAPPDPPNTFDVHVPAP